MINIKKLSILSLLALMTISGFATHAYASSDVEELSGLLKAELGIVVSEDKLNNLSSSKQTEIQNLLLMIERGRTLFSGKTPVENTLGTITKLIELELDKDMWDTILNSILKLTQTPVQTAKDIADKSTQVFLSASAIATMQAIPRERLVFEYIQNYRLNGLSDEDAWKNMINKYNSFETELSLACNPNALITGDGGCERVITMQRGGESLHVYAQLAYESFDLSQKLINNPELKEALKQKVLDDINEVSVANSETPSLLSRIWEFIAQPFRFLGTKIVSLFTKNNTNNQLPAQISDSVKSGYQNCPSYIFSVLESIGTKPTIPSIQTKVESLKIGRVSVREIEDNKFMVNVRNIDSPITEEARQRLVKIEQEIGLQEVQMEGGSGSRAKTCPTDDDFLSGLKPIPSEYNLSGEWVAEWRSTQNQSGISEIKIYSVSKVIKDNQGVEGVLLSGEGIQHYGSKDSKFKVRGTFIEKKEVVLYQDFDELKDTITYKGTINGGKGSGTWTNTLGSSGTWSMVHK